MMEYGYTVVNLKSRMNGQLNYESRIFQYIDAIDVTTGGVFICPSHH